MPRVRPVYAAGQGGPVLALVEPRLDDVPDGVVVFTRWARSPS